MHGRLALTPSPTQSGHKSHANLTAMSWVGGLGGKVFMSASMSSDFHPTHTSPSLAGQTLQIVWERDYTSPT